MRETSWSYFLTNSETIEDAQPFYSDWTKCCAVLAAGSAGKQAFKNLPVAIPGWTDTVTLLYDGEETGTYRVKAVPSIEIEVRSRNDTPDKRYQ